MRKVQLGDISCVQVQFELASIIDRPSALNETQLDICFVSLWEARK